VVDRDRVQCSTDKDCAARGEEFAGTLCIESICQLEPRWSCLERPAPPAPSGGPYQVTFQVQNILSMMPISGIEARLCRKLDVKCEDPVGEASITDGSGMATFAVAAGFEGYVRFTGKEIIPGLYFFNPPVRADLPLVPISIGSAEVIPLLAFQAGATQAPDRGVVLLAAQDCTGAPASGVILTANVKDPLAKQFYSEEGLPSGTAEQTDSAGYGGLLNAAPGSVTFSASIAASGREFGQVTLLVQEGSLTYGTVVPEGN
jgi:hypothetical protein